MMIAARGIPQLFGRATTPELGVCRDSDEPFELDFESMLTHALAVGRSGTGKSKSAQLYMRGLADAYVPHVLIDAEGDLAEDVFADVIDRARREESEAILHRTHYLRPHWDCVFGFDPFDPVNVPHDPVAHQAWLATRVKRMTGAIIRCLNETGTEAMPRLERIITDVLTAVGTAVGPGGARLPLANVFILLNFDHPKFDDVFAAVAPHLPPEIRLDFETLIALRNRPQELLRQTESTINRLRSFLGPLVKAMFSQVRRQTINLHRMITGRGIILFNLKDSEYFAPEQADALGRMLIYQVISAMRSVAKGQRFPCALIIDECQRFLTRDVLVALAQGRKWGLATTLLTQTLSALELVELGFGQTVLAAVGTVMCFQQRLPHDLDVLADYIFRPNLCHRELFSCVDRHRGYQWIDVAEQSESWSAAESWSEAQSQSQSAGFSRNQSLSLNQQQTNATARQSNWSDSDSHTDSHSRTEGRGNGTSQGQGVHLGESPIIQHGQVQMMLPTEGSTASSSNFDNHSNAETRGEARGTSHSRGGGLATIAGLIRGLSFSSGAAESGSQAESTSRNRGGSLVRGGSISYRRTPLAIIEPEYQATGRLRWAIADQLERYKTLLATLPVACAAVRRDGALTEVVQFHEVDDPFPGQQFRDAILQIYERKLHAIHNYFMKPDISPDALDRQIDAFLAAAGSTVTVPSSPPPSAGTNPHPF